MHYVFFGSPHFAACILEKLIISGYPPRLVICNPDRPSGRKKILTPPPTKQIAQIHHIPFAQPESLVHYQLPIHYTPDFGIVAAYARIIPQSIISLFPKGIIGVHPSLLPKLRGASPIQSALIAGEEETGVTLYTMDSKVDHGPILNSKKLELVIDDTYETLIDKLADVSSELLLETLPQFIEGVINPVEQNHKEATLTKKFVSEDAYINPQELHNAQKNGGEIAHDIYNKMRGLNPEPGVWTTENGKRLKLLAAKLVDEKLVLTLIQKEGKTPVHLH